MPIFDPAGWRREPQAYLVTFSCYGARVHGDERGSVDREHSAPGTPYLDAAPGREHVERRLMRSAPYRLDSARRDIVLKAVIETCRYRQWGLHAAHVRTTHVHAVVSSTTDRDTVLRDLKAYASRALNTEIPQEKDRKKWARHGSAPALWTDDQVVQAIYYVLQAQGSPMAVYSPGEMPPPSSEHPA